MRYGREISAAVDPLDLGWPAVAVRAGVGLVYSVLIEEVVTPRSVGGRTGAITTVTPQLKTRAHWRGEGLSD